MNVLEKNQPIYMYGCLFCRKKKKEPVNFENLRYLLLVLLQFEKIRKQITWIN